MKFDMIRFNLLILSVIFYVFISCGNAFAGDIQTNQSQTDATALEHSQKTDAVQRESEKQILPNTSDKPVVSDQKNRLVFNFDNADLTEVIRTLAELLEINYMLDAGVGGTVTIHTSGELSKKDLFPIFYQILDVNGLTAVKQNKIYKIIHAKDASRLPIMSRVGRDDLVVPPEERVIVQIIPLHSVSVSEMSKVLTPFISTDGTIISKENTNVLIVVDKSYNIKKVLRLVSVFDTDVFERMNHRFYSIQYGDVDSLAGILDKLLSSYGDAVKADVNFIPITRLNILLVMSSNPKVFAKLDEFIEKYDVPSENTESGIYFYPVKNGQAADIADILNKVFTGKSDKKGEKLKTGAASALRNPLGMEAKAAKAAAQAKKTEPKPVSGADVTMGSGTLRGEVKITTDESRNSLIIEATPADYQIVKNLLTKLDIMPRQVLIEVTLAEITLDKSTQMGVEWSYVKGNANMSTSLLNATMGNSGLNFTIGNSQRWTAAISALASENKVNILSSPSILASNSKPASIDISTEIPVASSQYQYTDNSDNLFETDIEYRDTGIMLTVTPNINESGLVTMDIDQEISEQASNVTVGNKEYPSFFKRSTKTTLTVQSGQTIVIGGLIKETKSDGESGTPWFVNIPVINFLFGKTKKELSRNELILLITPSVIATGDDVDEITREFKAKVDSLPLGSD
ncbi:MAG: type II secretion system secretin GspD [Dissulfuribacterales bacterium]